MNEQKISTQTLVRVALLIGLQIVLSRFLSISTPFAKIGFAFVPVAICAMLYGPVWAGFAGAASDFLGANLFPIGPYHPGFTLTAALTGVIFGLLLQKERENGWRGIVSAVVLHAAVVTVALNTLWICQLYPSRFTYLALLPTRMTQALVEIPVQVIVLRLLSTRRLQALLSGHGART